MFTNDEDIKQKTIDGGKGYAIISLISQVFSWVFTFLVIRLLNPSDYGLMAMASFLTSYIQVFSNLGLGAGIIQRHNVTRNDLSSIFWFSSFIGVAMSVAVYFLAYPNAIIFERDELIPITQLSAILFIISSISTVPQNILSRRYEFKSIAKINLVAAFISSVASIILALLDFGVYTLVLSSIILSSVTTIGFIYKSKWLPDLHFNYNDVHSFLKFGFLLSLASTLSHLLDTIDKLIIGKLYSVSQLGHYSTAINISDMPIDKISPLISPIIFPMLSRWKDDKTKCFDAYLNILTYYLLVISPIYIGGIIVADDLIEVVLGEKWVPIIVIFQFFCWVRFFKVLSSYHKVLITSQGLARNILKYDGIMLIVLMTGIYLAAINEFYYILYVWAIVYPIITMAWIFSSIRKFGETVHRQYSKAVLLGVMAALFMGVGLIALKYYLLPILLINISQVILLVILLLFGVLLYISFLYFFQKDLIKHAIATLLHKS